MHSFLVGLDGFLRLGVGLVGLMLLAVVVYGIFLLRRFGGGSTTPNKQAKPLPKHKVLAREVDNRWQDEASYEKMLNNLYREVQHAINNQDLDTLEIIAQGTAFTLFSARIQLVEMGSDKREVLQGSIRESWDKTKCKLVVILAVTRWVKGWRRCYEEWTLQRQGNAWFVVDAKATRLS